MSNRPPVSSRVRPSTARGLAMDTLFAAAQPYVEEAIRDYVAPAVGKGANFLGEVVKGATETMGGGVERGVYDYMTKDPETGQRRTADYQNIDEYKDVNWRKGPPRGGARIADNWAEGSSEIPVSSGALVGWEDKPVKGLAPIGEEGVPLGGPDNVQYYTNQRAGSKQVPGAGLHEGPAQSRFDGPGWLVDDPARTARWAGRAAIPAAVVGGLGALEYFTQGEKPRSDYAVPVQPSGGYNQSVESAMASAGAKYELEEQKHRHNLEMQSLREQSRIPGVQDTAIGGYGGVTNNLSSANPYAGMISTAFNSPSVFPRDPGVTSMGFG